MVRMRGKSGTVRRLVLACGVLAALMTSNPVSADGTGAVDSSDPYDGDWHFALTPYAWIPGMSAKLEFNAPPPDSGRAQVDLNATPINLLTHLKFAFAGFADARKGDWDVLTDFIYFKLGGNSATAKEITGPGGLVEIPVNLNTRVGFSSVLWTAGAGYSLYHFGNTSIDAFAGFRTMISEPSLQWNFAGPLSLFPQSGNVSEHEQAWDGLIGLRGRIGFSGSRWFIPYYTDIGTGQSNLTAQAQTGVGYVLSFGDLQLTYRYLYYQPGGGQPINHLSVNGIALGATMHL